MQETSQSAESLTLKILKTFNPNILEILFNSTFSALYEYDEAIEKWNPLNMEGCLYLTKNMPPLINRYELSKDGEGSAFKQVATQKTKGGGSYQGY